MLHVRSELPRAVSRLLRGHRWMSSTSVHGEKLMERFKSINSTRSFDKNDKNVGTGKTVTVTGYLAPSTNYTITQPTGLSADITEASLTVTGISISNKI